MDVGPAELIIVLVIILVLFGGAKLPKLAKSLGEAQREFRRGTHGETEDEPKPPSTAPAAEAPAALADPGPLSDPGPLAAPAAEPVRAEDPA